MNWLPLIGRFVGLCILRRSIYALCSATLYLRQAALRPTLSADLSLQSCGRPAVGRPLSAVVNAEARPQSYSSQSATLACFCNLPSKMGPVRAIGSALRTVSRNMSGSSGYVGPLAAASSLNSAVLEAQYAVRGELVIRANELRELVKSGVVTKFNKVIFCNIGNPQSLGQFPLTFLRQVIAGAVLNDPEVHSKLASDASERSRNILREAKSVGAYSHSKGVPWIRQRVSRAIEKRDDGVPSDPESIFLTNGASDGVKSMLTMLIRNSKDGVLVPIPQYPLYSASMTLLGGTQVNYFLDEDEDWGLHISDLQKSVDEARKNGTNVRAIVVINPGNPTGQTLTRANMEELVRFCERENLLIIADEVYQTNVYDPKKPFVSFKKVVYDMKSPVQLASLHSVSKGVMGECGLRGGYLEVHNFPNDVMSELYKLQSISLCAAVIGQVAVDVMMTPPQPEDESYELWQKETNSIFESLKRRANKLSHALNEFEGVSCNKAEGAMYLFPKIKIPPAAIEEARRHNKSPDTYYCLQLLEETGICVVPGSGFGQKEGTWHFRTTMLPPEDDIDEVVRKMGAFHSQFLQRFT